MALSQSTNHIMMMEPVDFLSNPETMETNTYQHDNPSDLLTVRNKARQEFRSLRDRIVDHGILVTTALGQTGCPDDIFCNNWVSTHADGTAVYYPMLAPNRRLERRPELLSYFEKTYRVALDLSAEELKGKYLESTGSHWLDRVNKIAYVALSPRTDYDLAKKFCDTMGYQFLPFETRNHVGKPVYHADVMMFIGTGYAGVCLECILPDYRDKVRASLEKTHEVIPLTLDQLRSFCGNALELVNKDGKKYLTMSEAAYMALTDAQKKSFEKYIDGFIYSDIPTIEQYGGGSVRCMLLELF